MSGRLFILIPVASAIALAIAGATGPNGFSPMPLELYGPAPISEGSKSVINSGISLMLGNLYSPKVGLVTLPSEISSPSVRANPIDWITAPSI